jgi:hypothetical protein
MERKNSEQAPMSIGWYINEIKRLEASLFEARQTILREGQILMRLENEVARLNALVQEHQTYQTKQGEK